MNGMEIIAISLSQCENRLLCQLGFQVSIPFLHEFIPPLLIDVEIFFSRVLQCQTLQLRLLALEGFEEGMEDVGGVAGVGAGDVVGGVHGEGGGDGLAGRDGVFLSGLDQGV